MYEGGVNEIILMILGKDLDKCIGEGCRDYEFLR